ncbi:MAG: gamma-glutamylcyclotransferase [Clostridiaceae bacterium]|nr:gamma-glutamylcyclotransferase [Clostridiaceae bacterium]
MDTFFTQKYCERCGNSLDGGRQMSIFNHDCICMSCIEKEKQHPDYKLAKETEISEVMKGNYNFGGIGYTKKI